MQVASQAPWHNALRAFSQQLFAGQELSGELAGRISSTFERQGNAADFLRWWIIYRCENVPPAAAEGRALLHHAMWKQALFTAAIALPPTYSEFGHHAIVAACRAGNWRSALQLCQSWRSAEEILSVCSELDRELVCVPEVGGTVPDGAKPALHSSHSQSAASKNALPSVYSAPGGAVAASSTIDAAPIVDDTLSCDAGMRGPTAIGNETWRAALALLMRVSACPPRP